MFKRKITDFVHPIFRKPLWDKGFVVKELIDRGGVVLDVGCGDSFLAEVVRAEGNKVICLDIAPKAVETAKRKDFPSIRCDAQKLPLKEGFFDSSICLEVLEHLLSPEDTLQEIHRVLKPNGMLIVSTPNLVSLELRVSILIGYGFGILTGHGIRYPEEKKHIRFFTMSSLTRLLIDTGFRPVFSTGTEFPIKLSWLPKFLYPQGLNLRKFLGRILKTFSYSLLVKSYNV